MTLGFLTELCFNVEYLPKSATTEPKIRSTAIVDHALKGNSWVRTNTNGMQWKYFAKGLADNSLHDIIDEILVCYTEHYIRAFIEYSAVKECKISEMLIRFDKHSHVSISPLEPSHSKPHHNFHGILWALNGSNMVSSTLRGVPVTTSNEYGMECSSHTSYTFLRECLSSLDRSFQLSIEGSLALVASIDCWSSPVRWIHMDLEYMSHRYQEEI